MTPHAAALPVRKLLRLSVPHVFLHRLWAPLLGTGMVAVTVESPATTCVYISLCSSSVQQGFPAPATTWYLLPPIWKVHSDVLLLL
jgi:hypothetical protein